MRYIVSITCAGVPRLLPWTTVGLLTLQSRFFLRFFILHSLMESLFSHPVPVLVQTSVALLAATSSTVSITAWFGLKETFGGHGVHPYSKQGYSSVRLLRTMSRQVWIISILVFTYSFPSNPFSP